MSVHITENFGDLLDARVRKWYFSEWEENVKESMIPMLFGMESSNRNYEIESGVGGLQDVPDFDGTITYASQDQLYDKTYTFPEKALGIKVERQLYDDDLSGIMKRRSQNLAISAARTREKSAAAIFNGAFVGTDGPDSLSLCNGSHPYSPEDATTQSNAGSTAISATAIEATRIIGMTSIFHDNGELLDVNYDTIVVPPNLNETAWEVINSSGKVDTANNNRNVHYGKYKLVEWARLTDSTNWFMLDSKLCKLFMLWWDRVKPEFDQDRDFDSMVAKWRVYMRYTVGWSAWHGIYGHNVS